MAPATASRPLPQGEPRAACSLRPSAESRLVLATAGGRNSGRAVAAPADLAGSDDRALMLEFQQRGDPAAFEELFRRHRLPLYRYLRGLAGAAEIAEETSQHAWLKVIEAARSAGYVADGRSVFKTWLYTLARNHYIDRYLRAHARSRTDSNCEELLLSMATEPDAPAAQLDREHLGDTLARAMATLPLEQREVALLWAQGHELTAIAAVTGAPWETVVSRKRYALAKLRAALALAGVTQGDL
jgi:RNA polymerase sigma-70 factor, ECF subfamily